MKLYIIYVQKLVNLFYMCTNILLLIIIDYMCRNE